MSFKIEGLVHNKRSEAHYSVNIASFGTRKGEEVINTSKEDGILTGTVYKLRIPKSHPTITFTWYPPEGQKQLFQQMKKDTLDIEFTVGMYNSDGNKIVAEWTLTVDGVHIKNILPDKKKFNDFVRTDERIDASFTKITWKEK